MAFVAACLLLAATPASTITSNRSWERLEPPKTSSAAAFRASFRDAARKLKRPVYVDAVRIDGRVLARLARAQPKEPFLRVVRERLRRPVDLEDLLYFIDDVIVAREADTNLRVWLPASRARDAGIFIHPDDVFLDNQPRRYGTKEKIAIDKPKPLARLAKAADGELLGPRWCGRYPNPSGTRRKLRALDRLRPEAKFGVRTRSLMTQLEQQRATVLLYSTVRDRRRGYLIWGAYSLSRLTDEAKVSAQIALLERLNTEWNVKVPIRWKHPDGWEATVRAARQMADAYRVAFATRDGAERSKHYDGVAVDLNVFGLPRKLTLVAPDGAKRTFDLSDPDEPRDLSLTPALIEWVEAHFSMQKLREDYPHWEDAEESPSRDP